MELIKAASFSRATIQYRQLRQMEPNESQFESLLDYAQRIKGEDRRRLWETDPNSAQLDVDAVLTVAAWSIVDPARLVWPGDLGDDAEEPAWMTEP